MRTDPAALVQNFYCVPQVPFRPDEDGDQDKPPTGKICISKFKYVDLAYRHILTSNEYIPAHAIQI